MCSLKEVCFINVYVTYGLELNESLETIWNGHYESHRVSYDNTVFQLYKYFSIVGIDVRIVAWDDVRRSLSLEPNTRKKLPKIRKALRTYIFQYNKDLP